MLALVNESMAYARLGETKKADESLQKALKISPNNAAANFNLGLLKAEQNDRKGAEKYLQVALKADPQMAQAAYNLCIITAKDRLNEAVPWCRKAAELRPQEPKYAYTLAFYLQQQGDSRGAATVLESLISRVPAYGEAYLLLGDIYKDQGKKKRQKPPIARPWEKRGYPKMPASGSMRDSRLCYPVERANPVKKSFCFLTGNRNRVILREKFSANRVVSRAEISQGR